MYACCCGLEMLLNADSKGREKKKEKKRKRSHDINTPYNIRLAEDAPAAWESTHI
jgi:hypothetical protein